MTASVYTPQSRCRVGFARADVTPPVGIYHRMWGAAVHDRAAGVHRQLAATALWMESLAGSGRRLVLGLDLCLLDRPEFVCIRERIAAALGIAFEDVFVSLSHTHGSGWLSRSRAHLDGGDRIGPYLDRLAETAARLAGEAVAAAQPATILYGRVRCSLAAQRDFWDVETPRLNECRARAEQMTRQIARLSALPDGRVYPLPVDIARLGGAVWVFTPAELYQSFQTTLRSQFPETAVIVATITNDWQPGYIPPADRYGYGIYQETIAATAPGSLEALTAAVARVVREMLAERSE